MLKWSRTQWSAQGLLDGNKVIRPQTFAALASEPNMQTSFGLPIDHAPITKNNMVRLSPYLQDQCALCAGGRTYVHEDVSPFTHGSLLCC